MFFGVSYFHRKLGTWVIHGARHLTLERQMLRPNFVRIKKANVVKLFY